MTIQHPLLSDSKKHNIKSVTVFVIFAIASDFAFGCLLKWQCIYCSVHCCLVNVCIVSECLQCPPCHPPAPLPPAIYSHTKPAIYSWACLHNNVTCCQGQHQNICISWRSRSRDAANSWLKLSNPQHCGPKGWFWPEGGALIQPQNCREEDARPKKKWGPAQYSVKEFFYDLKIC